MPFNATDPSSVDAAEKAGLDKARELSEVLLRLLEKARAALNANRPDEKLGNEKPGNDPAPGEYPNDIDPNITNEQHDLYAKVSAEYQHSGADIEVAKAAAFDFAIRGQGADKSKNVAIAHEQIADRALGTEMGTDAEPIDQSNESLSFMQMMTGAGVDIAVARAINSQRIEERLYAEDVMANRTSGFDQPVRGDLAKEISNAVKNSEIARFLTDQHETELRAIFLKEPNNSYKFELISENHSARLVGLGLNDFAAEQLTTVRNNELFDAVQLGQAQAESGKSGSGDLFKSAIEKSSLEPDAQIAIIKSFDKDLENSRELGRYEAAEKDARTKRFALYRSQSKDLTSAACQAFLQGEAIPTVYQMVIEAQPEGTLMQKATENAEQIVRAAQENIKKLTQESAAVSQLIPATSQSGTPATQRDRASTYEGTLLDSGATHTTAQKAAQDLSAGKGADDSANVRQAHREVLAHNHLREMYERVYESLNVPPAVAQSAAQDAAKGLGANTSAFIAQAHSLATVSSEIHPNLDADNWAKYASQFRVEKAKKYPGDKAEPTPHALMQGAAKVALQAGEPKETVVRMIQNSPLNNPPGGDRAAQAKGIVTKVSNAIDAKAKSEAKATGKSASKPRVQSSKIAQKAGVEM
jgi:hypothetical protein